MQQHIKRLGLVTYLDTHQQMLNHIENNKSCEIWLLEHQPVYTMGKRSLPEHIKKKNAIPCVPTDRGGQVTYHGPGQLIAYPMIHLDTWNLTPLSLVSLLENCTIEALDHFNILANSNPEARGIYVNKEKVASIGLKIKQGYAYHGIAININMDLSPFDNIVPCGDETIIMTQVSDHTYQYELFEQIWIKILLAKLCTTRYNL